MFGEWLRQQRESHRLTREEFAERIACSVSTLRKIESGERRPSHQIAGLMANALNIPPAEHTTFIKVARGDLNLERLISHPHLNPHPDISSPRTNLPVLPTPLIGRQPELEKLGGLLGDPQCRLLTLVGPGGIGKTRLAIEIASHMQAAFVDGVYFIPLASINSIRYIVPVITDAVGFAFQSANSADPKAQLFNFLREKKILFLIDNLEHLLNEPSIDLLTELLSNAPQIKILATSRESLGFHHEWIFEVHGLPIPENDNTEDTSIELFTQRARRAHAGFNPTPEDFRAIRHICQLVGGTPLALELAAAWVRTLTCDEIANEIERNLDFLNTSTRDIPVRHRSIRAVFDHSWKLLTAEEQHVLERLSVFRGGFLHEAAEHIAGASLPILSALIAKSLIRRGGNRRYGLHELIRQHAADRLAEQPKAREAAQKRHALYYLESFSGREISLRSSAQLEIIDELTAEIDNLRVAWDWSIIHHEFASCHQAAKTLWYLCELRTWFDEGELIFRKLAEAIQSHADGDQAALDMANEMRGHSAYHAFRQGKTVPAYDELIRVRAQLPPGAIGYVQLYLGIICRDLGKFTEANEVLQDSFVQAETHHDEWLQSMAGQFLGIIALEMGDPDLAHRHLMEALEMGRKIGDPMLTAHALGFASLSIQTVGDIANAENFLRESLAITQKIGYRWGIGNALDALGVFTQRSNPYEARQLFAAGIDIYKEIGDLRSLARALSHQGYNSLAMDDIADARISFAEALRLARECNYTPYALDAMTGFASLAAGQCDMERAFELLLRVLNHPASIKNTKERASQLMAKLEAQLTSAQKEVIQTHVLAGGFESTVEDLLK